MGIKKLSKSWPLYQIFLIFGDGVTPILRAAQDGCTEIVKILAPLRDNPNAPNKTGVTPYEVAKNEEIRGILENFKTSKNHN